MRSAVWIMGTAIALAALVTGGIAGQFWPTAAASIPAPEGRMQSEVTDEPAEKADPALSRLGLSLRPADAAAVARANPSFHGGMRVMAVRAGSPAAKAAICAGDILVGVHYWETVKHDDVAYALSSCRHDGMKRVRFYVLRNGQIQRADLPLK